MPDELKNIENILQEVFDPEIPVLSIMDLGVVREIEKIDDVYLISITPTYSGCPAMDVIAEDIIAALASKGLKASVKNVLTPVWTTDFITQKGLDAMEEYGIAPPLNASADKEALTGKEKKVKCTHCGSMNTKMLSQFGSTACKALFQCNDCKEPFDYFKCLK